MIWKIRCHSATILSNIKDMKTVRKTDNAVISRAPTWKDSTPTLLMSNPCLYVLRFANKLEFGEKTHEVTMTALRLVQRMKRDSMHYGRRPSGICGAALLMAARLHEFNRTVGDIVKVVQVHETTLRKRLVEFGETPSSSLTLTEFMTVDLEEEQDPPSYKAARAKDRERLKGFEDKERLKQFNRLQYEIEKHISEKKKRKLHDEETTNDEEGDINNFISRSTFDVIDDLDDEDEDDFGLENSDIGLGPSVQTMGLMEQKEAPLAFEYETVDGSLDITGLDDSELDAYIMTKDESAGKGAIWNSNNAAYLKAKQEKEEKLRKEQEEGKAPDKKKKKVSNKRKGASAASSAGEAIEKMLQEKKISTKINYDVLKSLNINLKPDGSAGMLDGMKAECVTKEEIVSGLKDGSKQMEQIVDASDQSSNSNMLVSVRSENEPVLNPSTKLEAAQPPVEDDYGDIDDDDDYDGDDGAAGCGSGVLSVAQMLSQQYGDDNQDGSYYSYDDNDDDY